MAPSGLGDRPGSLEEAESFSGFQAETTGREVWERAPSTRNGREFGSDPLTSPSLAPHPCSMYILPGAS